MKCFYMQFSGYSKINLNRLEIGRVKLKRVDEVKYLGVYLSSHLNFDSQIHNIYSRMKDASIAVQNLISYSPHQFSDKEKLQIYKKAIEPIMLNGYLIWSNYVLNQKKFVDKLRNAQKLCLVRLFGESEEMRNSELCRRYRICPIDIELEIRLSIKKNGDQLKRTLTKKECENIRLKVMQKYHFHF